MMNRLMLALGVCILLGCASNKTKTGGDVPPAAAREFRAVWVATVTNIDWPTEPGLSTEQQQKEAIAILDQCAANNMNAVVLQVRTSCDAMYPSKLEPWSYYLTGEQGKAPEPYYDPLKFWIDEAHKRGIELHAWFNPYRARVAASDYSFAKSHLVNAHPDSVKKYGKMHWLDPGDKFAADHSYRVFMDVVKRYDVDGIHIDDYFYPYPVKSETDGEVPFPDDNSYGVYTAAGGKLPRDDWRRENVNQLVERIYKGTKHHKKWVKFGISPFGLYRPGYPEGTKGFDQYTKLYADALLWLKQGWCDYWTPQLYWKIGHPTVPFEPLLKYWVAENSQARHIWPGLFTSKLHEKPEKPTTAPQTPANSPWTTQDILDQIQITHQTKGATGNVHFSANALTRNSQKLNDALQGGPYRQDALVPASTWLDSKPPATPNVKISAKEGKTIVHFKPAMFSEKVWQFGVYLKYGDTWRFHVLPGHTRTLELTSDTELGAPTVVAVSAVDRCGNESGPKVAAIK